MRQVFRHTFLVGEPGPRRVARFVRISGFGEVGPGCNELIGEFPGLIPGLIASKALLEQISNLISERGMDVSTLEAPSGANDALGKPINAPAQMREGEFDQLALHLMPLGFVFGRLRLKPCSVDETHK